MIRLWPSFRPPFDHKIYIKFISTAIVVHSRYFVTIIEWRVKPLEQQGCESSKYYTCANKLSRGKMYVNIVKGFVAQSSAVGNEFGQSLTSQYSSSNRVCNILLYWIQHLKNKGIYEKHTSPKRCMYTCTTEATSVNAMKTRHEHVLWYCDLGWLRNKLLQH